VDPQTLFDQLKAQAGFDVQKELLSWMGDATVFVRGTDVAGVNGALVVTSKDPAASQAAIGRLRTLVQSMGGVTPAPLTGAAGATGFEVTVPGAPGPIAVAAKDDKFVVAYGTGALAAALDPGGKLGDSAAYADGKDAINGAAPSFFLDVPQVVALLKSAAGSSPGFAKAEATLDALGPLAVGSSRDGDTQHVQVGIKVK
jgi:hypothetical protein